MSWKKYFVAYMAATKTFFAFPRLSFSTNFNDPGTHRKLKIDQDGQVSLVLSDRIYRFKNFAESYCQYDSHFELLPEKIKNLSESLQPFDFETDLYGEKALDQINKEYVITSRPVKKHILSFARALKPHDLNVILNLEGNELFLSRTDNVLPLQSKAKRELSDYKYFYTSRIIGKKAFLREYFSKHKPFSFFFK